MHKLKITVMKRTLHRDLVDEYRVEEIAKQTGPCPILQDGQEFITESPWSPPEGFCHGAWADMRRYVMTLTFGGEFPISKPANTVIACCTDGYRPVIFKIERIED